MNGKTPLNKFISYLGEDGTRAHKYWNFVGAWCCGEVAMVMKQVGGNLFYDGKKVVYCPTAYAWCKTHLQKIPTRNAQYGDIIFFDWNNNGVPDHIGMVEYVSGSTVHTIEGNTGSPARVRRRVRESYILGIFRPKYEPPKPQDYLVTVDGEWGYHTCLATQYVLGGLELDGVLGKATVKAIQKKVGADVDGAWGTDTCKAMSKFLNIKEQTSKTKTLIKAWQKWLNNEINGKIDPPEPTPPTPTPSGFDGELPKLHITKTTEEVIADTVAWAKWIASDNSFHYGKKEWSHHGGCYFCGTETQIKGSHNGHELKTYCCNPFLGSAFAHGGLDKYCLGLCKKGKNANFCWGAIEKGTFATLFKKVALKKGNLKAGDVLSKTGHMAMYVGNEKLVEAATSDDDKPNSTKWNNSIHVSAMRYGGFTDAYRYVGSVDMDHDVTHGDISDDVKRMQEFLKWYGADITPDRVFGDKTLEAVKKFQKDMGITADGIFGKNSLAKAKEVTK